MKDRKIGMSQMASNQRVDFIDTLRGLCMMSIVWYHTDHPNFLNYPFYNATLFFVSGMLFKPCPERQFFKKKFFSLFIPFVFFYLIYYVFLLLLNYGKYHSVSNEIWTSVFDVFRNYRGTDGYVCNYPLWFIWALFWIQLITNELERYLKKPLMTLLISFVVSIVGLIYIQQIPTSFMIGRSFTFLVYYVTGYVVGKRLIRIEQTQLTFVLSLLLFAFFLYMSSISCSGVFASIIYCCGFLSIAVALLMLCRQIQKLYFVHIITYFGVNSLVVFGMHDMYLTIFRIITQYVIGEMNLWLGFINWIITMVAMIPTIILLNRFVPFWIGKKV